jgi:hypothetical protein
MLNKFRELLANYSAHKVKERDDLLGWHQRYRAVFGTPDGQLVLADIMKKNFVFDAAEVGNPSVSTLREGQRYAALSIFRFIERDPKELIEHENTTRPRPADDTYWKSDAH